MIRYILPLWASHFQKRYRKTTLPATIFITDNTRVPDIAKAIQILPKNSMVIIRDYEIPEREAYAKHIIGLARRYGHKVLVANDVILAVKYHADGVHFPEWNYRKAIAYKSRNPDKIVSVAIHSLKSLIRLPSIIDMALVSPVFPTRSHPDARTLGIKSIRILCRQGNIPVYPLGGVSANNIRQLKAVNIPGIAAIDGLSSQI